MSDQPITVAEAITLLQHIQAPEAVLVVPYESSRVTLGPSPAIAVNGIYRGFDWNNGKVFLHTVDTLGEGGERAQRTRDWARRAADTLASIELLIKRTDITAEARLEQVQACMRQFVVKPRRQREGGEEPGTP